MRLRWMRESRLAFVSAVKLVAVSLMRLSGAVPPSAHLPVINNLHQQAPPSHHRTLASLSHAPNGLFAQLLTASLTFLVSFTSPPHIAQRPGRTYVQDEDFSYSHHPHEASTSSRPFSNLSFARVPPTNFVTASPFQEQAREALMEEDEAEVVVVSKAAVPAPVVVKASAAPKRKAKSSSAFTNAKRPKKGESLPARPKE